MRTPTGGQISRARAATFEPRGGVQPIGEQRGRGQATTPAGAPHGTANGEARSTRGKGEAPPASPTTSPPSRGIGARQRTPAPRLSSGRRRSQGLDPSRLQARGPVSRGSGFHSRRRPVFRGRGRVPGCSESTVTPSAVATGGRGGGRRREGLRPKHQAHDHAPRVRRRGWASRRAGDFPPLPSRDRAACFESPRRRGCTHPSAPACGRERGPRSSAAAAARLGAYARFPRQPAQSPAAVVPTARPRTGTPPESRQRLQACSTTDTVIRNRALPSSAPVSRFVWAHLPSFCSRVPPHRNTGSLLRSDAAPAKGAAEPPPSSAGVSSLRPPGSSGTRGLPQWIAGAKEWSRKGYLYSQRDHARAGGRLAVLPGGVFLPPHRRCSEAIAPQALEQPSQPHHLIPFPSRQCDQLDGPLTRWAGGGLRPMYKGGTAPPGMRGGLEPVRTRSA